VDDREYEEYIEQVEEREAMIFEDPREKPRDGVTILRRRCGRLDLETFTPIFVYDGGLPKVEATALCQHAGGILLDNIEFDRAEKLVAALNQAGEDCFTVPAAEIIELPREVQVHRARITREHVDFVDITEKFERALWAKTVVLTMGRVTLVAEKTVTTAKSAFTRKIGGVAMLGPTGAALGAAMSPVLTSKTKRSSSLHTIVDIVALAGLRRFRIDGRSFDYTILGDTVQPGSEANVRLLVRWFLQQAPHAMTNFDAAELVSKGDTDIPAYDERGFDAVSHWALNMIKLRAR